MTRSDYLVFVDESGDHGLETIDAQYPVFVLAFCIISQLDYSRVLLPAVTEFKCGHFGHDQVILHERDIRKDLGDFAVLREKVRKQAFLDELTAIIDMAPMTIIACAVRKDRLVSRYAYPNNAYELALGLGLERVARWLETRSRGTTTVIVECRGRREDDELELEFRRVCAGGNYRNEALALEPRFVPKSANVPGLQICGSGCASHRAARSESISTEPRFRRRFKKARSQSDGIDSWMGPQDLSVKT